MRKLLILFLVFAAINRTQAAQAAKAAPPDTVVTGVYITSIHDIDFRQQEYTVNLWLWLKYKNKDFDFLNNLEVPLAKTVTKSFSTIDSSGGRIYILMKLQCVMKDSWRIGHFPFDRQKLRFSIENSQYDSRALVFKAEEGGQHYDPRFTLNGWNIDSFIVKTGVHAYETAFGDSQFQNQHSEYATYKVGMLLERKAMDLFWKMFLGMYVAFLIAYISFYIHADAIESRFGLTVGSIFAVVGNKYIVDSELPESSSFTLVDTLHGITLLCIFIITLSSVYSLHIMKKRDLQRANRFDRIAAVVVLIIYLSLNALYISKAVER